MKRFYLFALMAMFFAACTTDETQDVQLADVPETLTVSFEEDTRIQLNEAQKTVWSKDDLVSVFYKSDANDCWKFTGDTGDRTATLQRVSKGEGTRRGDNVIVVYPYRSDYLVSLSSNSIEAYLPETQTYCEGSYGVGSSPMVGFGDYKQFVLKNVCGWLKLQLTGNGERVQSISLKGNNGEQVAGDILIVAEDASTILASASVDVDDSEVGGSLLLEDDILTEVTLDCGNGVKLGAEATTFYIALPPQTFENGLTVEIETAEGKIMTKSTDKSLTIERNTIQPMASVAYNGIFKPANNEIYYTNGSTTEATIPSSTNVFGANIVSNLYDAEKECWVITFDGDVTMIGERAFEGYYNTDCNITSIVIPDSVTSIGKRAFSSCTSLTSVTIPDSVTSIGQWAFENCTSLTRVDITDLSAWCKISFDRSSANPLYNGAKLYINNTEATNITIPSDITEIKNYAFCGCTSLTSVTIPDSVTSIGVGAFSSCTSLTSVTIPDSVTSIGDYAFYRCGSLTSVTIPDSVTSIGNFAFQRCSSLTNVTIPDSVTSIGEWAFLDCTSLTSVNITNLLAWCKISFDDYSANPLYNGAKLYINNTEATDIIIPSDITEIKNYAFYGCTSLTSITIPDSVTSIGKIAFANCTSLRRVDITDLSAWCKISFGDSYANPLNYGEKLYLNGSELTNITIPSDITEIKNYAFDGCSSLTSVTIPNSVTSIGEDAFYNCTSLTSVTIPDSVTSIGSYAFNSCKSLTSVTIGNSVTSIGEYAFWNCSSLKEVYCKPITTPAGGQYMFSYYSNGSYVPIGCKIYVPASDDDSIINVYKAKSGWSDYASYIEEYDFSAEQ